MTSIENGNRVVINVVSENDEVEYNAQKKNLLMSEIRAPLHSSEERSSRAPVVISAVLDRSGSMSGGKLDLVKSTMQFVVANMKPEDQLGLISYDDCVKEELKLTYMTPEGKKRAVDILLKIQTGGSTNLSEGLFSGLKQLQGFSFSTTPQDQDGSSPTGGQAVVASAWLFTDGLANAGIQNAAALTQETESRLSKIVVPCSIFTFGFGRDHDPMMLREISRAGHGQYYFVETEDEIPEAFSDCLGGLLSVAAQNLVLTATPSPGYPIVKVHTSFKTETNEGNTIIRVPDLYSEETRNVIFEVEVPALRLPHAEPHPVVTFTLQYFNVVTCQQEEMTHVWELPRPETCTAPPKPMPVELDKHQNRILCADALAQANNLSSTDQLPQAREVLSAAIEKIKASVSASDRLCVSLLSNLQESLGNLQDQHTYRCYGAPSMTSYEGAHRYQRSSHRTPVYSTICKDDMMRMARDTRDTM